MELNISHRTRYQHAEGVPYGLLELRKQPLDCATQAVEDWSIRVDGGKAELDFRDHNGNQVVLVSYEMDSSVLEVVSEGRVVTGDNHGVYGAHDGIAPLWYYRRVTALTRPGAQIRQFVKSLSLDAGDDLDRLHALSEAIRERVSYDKGRTDTATDAETAFGNGHGVCQDHTHVMLAAARLLGFPARYVGGYLLMDGQVSQEAGHAWTEVYVPDLGWVGFDVSNGISPDEHYVRVATGLDYREAAPVTGLRFGSGEETMAVTVQVQQ